MKVPTFKERSPSIDDPDSPSAGRIAGQLVTETLDYDGGRQVTVYVPPDPPEAVVFAPRPGDVGGPAPG